TMASASWSAWARANSEEPIDLGLIRCRGHPTPPRIRGPTQWSNGAVVDRQTLSPFRGAAGQGRPEGGRVDRVGRCPGSTTGFFATVTAAPTTRRSPPGRAAE